MRNVTLKELTDEADSIINETLDGFENPDNKQHIERIIANGPKPEDASFVVIAMKFIEALLEYRKLS